MSTPQVAAIPCDCPARFAPVDSDEYEEHTMECAFRPQCLDATCHNFGKAMIVQEDEITALLDGGYECPPDSARILDLGNTLADYVANSDFFTDAPEYAEAVAKAKEMARELLALTGGAE